MAGHVFDYSAWRPDPADLVAAGVVGVSRYLATPAHSWKVITKAEYDRTLAAGLPVVLNWEETAGSWRGGYNLGRTHGTEARRQARALGHPDERPIIQSVDTAVNPDELATAVAYQRGFNDGGGCGPQGVYGTAYVIGACFSAGLVRVGWQAAARAWYGNSTDSTWASLIQRTSKSYPQFPPTAYDENDVRSPDWGQHPMSYPFGYAGQTVTEVQLATKTTWQRLHPEMRRRFMAMMKEAATKGVSLGVGTGWRKQPTNPDGTPKPGFAAPGNSYHEGFMPGGTTRPDGVNDRNAMAIDSVLSSAWPWMNANCGRFGLIHFANVNNEPWHVQPAEIPRSRNFATHEPPLQVWPLPEGDDVPLTEAEFDKIAAKVWAYKLDHPTTGVPNTPAANFMTYILRNCADLYEGSAPGSPPTENEFKAAIAATQAAFNAAVQTILEAIEAIPGGGGEGGGESVVIDLAAIAKAVNDDAAARLQA